MTPEKLLKQCAALQVIKRKDYSNGEIHQNFDRSEEIIGWFKEDVDKVYVTLITTKLARLAVLLSSDEPPKNESIQDSFIDLINYASLWGSKRS